MLIRKATKKDFNEIENLYNIAKRYMKANNNPSQWKENYPSIETIEEDYRDDILYVIEDKGIIRATFVLLIGEEPTYKIINGKWLNDLPYGVIHRLAKSEDAKGVFNMVIEFSEKQINNLRIDTHRDNIIMLNLIEKAGFKYCGIVYMEDGKERMAFQRIKNVN